MKGKRILLLIIMATVAALASGCSQGGNWAVTLEVTEPYVEGNPTTLQLKVMEEGQPVSDVMVSAVMEMKKMSHGTVQVDFMNDGPGMYKGVAELSMPGEWTAVIVITDGKRSKEQLIDITIR